MSRSEAHAAPASIYRWSTSDVPARQRTAYFAEFVDNAVIPLGYSFPADQAFHGTVEAIALGPMSLMRHAGSRLKVFTEAAHIERQQEHCFDLVLSRNVEWRLEHRSRVLVEPRSAVLTDSRVPIALEQAGAYDFLNIKIPASWLRQWVAHPGVLLGRPLSAVSGWGQALNGFAAALTPAALLRPAVPPEVIADQLGALLALAAADLGSGAPEPRARSLVRRIDYCIAERCGEPALTASQVAQALGISPRTLHRHLAAAGTTFGAVLQGARVAHAARMLKSNSFAKFTTADIGRRAGFSDPSHFARTFRRKMGLAPAEFRRDPGLHGDER